MKHTIKSFLTTPFVCLILIISLIALPINASARTGTLGTENPEITCTFVDSTGKTVGGDHLYPGDYTVNFLVSGMASVSIFQITGTYDDTKISNFELESSNTRFELGGQRVSNNEFVAFLISNNSTTSSILSTGTVMLTYTITVAKAGDFADMVQLSTDPNQTFIEADYGDGYYDAYVLDTDIEYAAGNTYAATADLSPYVTPDVFTVSGKITVASDMQGTPSDKGMSGITVYVDGEDIAVATDKDGEFSLRGLEPGSYTITIRSNCSADRKATIEVSAEDADYDVVNAGNIGLVPCDYNKDNFINATDVFIFSRGAAKNDTKSDFNKDGVVDESDGQILKDVYLGHSVDYSSVSF